jgi:hypothetical protein
MLTATWTSPKRVVTTGPVTVRAAAAGGGDGVDEVDGGAEAGGVEGAAVEAAEPGLGVDAWGAPAATLNWRGAELVL